MRTAALLLALTALSACALETPRKYFRVPQGQTLSLDVSPPARRARVTVERGRTDVIFRGDRLELHARVEAGWGRGTVTEGDVRLVEITALEPSIVVVQTE